MRVLFLTNLLPYPLDNGGKIKTYTTLKALSDSGCVIDLLCFKETVYSMESEISEMLKLCNSVDQAYMPITTASHKKYMLGIAIKSLFSLFPFSVYKYQSKEMEDKIKEKLKFHYDVLYFDHLPMCVYLKFARKLWPDAKIILDEHNCETIITKRKAEETNNVFKRIFLLLEYFKLEKFEVNSIKHVDKTIVLSGTDYNTLKRMSRQEFSHSIIPIGVQDRGIKKFSNNTALNILFIGTLTWEPNNAGLIWFLREVMPIIENTTSFHLYVVGKNPSEEVASLCESYKDKITLTGYVDFVDVYYDKCDVTIVPLFIGSGQRVKIIEAFSKGMPAVSTSIGAEGLNVVDKENILIADTVESFKDALLKLKDPEIRSKIGKNARVTYESFYSLEAVSAKLESVIKGLFEAEKDGAE